MNRRPNSSTIASAATGIALVSFGLCACACREPVFAFTTWRARARVFLQISGCRPSQMPIASIFIKICILLHEAHCRSLSLHHLAVATAEAIGCQCPPSTTSILSRLTAQHTTHRRHKHARERAANRPKFGFDSVQPYQYSSQYLFYWRMLRCRAVKRIRLAHMCAVAVPFDCAE